MERNQHGPPNILINGVKCFLILSKILKIKAALFLFEIDNQKFERILLKNNKEDKVSFNIDGIEHNIKNPTSISLRKSIKILNNSEPNKFNKDMVYSIT